MKLHLAGIGGIDDGMYQDELQMRKRSGETPSGEAERGGQVKQEAGYDELKQMSLESLLYYVLVGGGRVSMQREETRDT